MKPPGNPLSIRSLPRQFQTKAGQSLCLDLVREQHHQPLVDMYLAYQPRGSIQGLPPLRDSECVKWVEHIIRMGIGIIATSSAHEIEGHIVLFPANDKKCEILVVVRPTYQDVGIGTELVRSCIQVACELRFEQMWLPVAAANVRARHVYKKCGFQYMSDTQAREIDMMCDLKQAPPHAHP